MKYLFTGASGFIGSHFHNAIDNNTIVNIDLKEPRFQNESRYIQGDIRIKEDIEKAFVGCKVDILIHLAAEHKDFGIPESSYFATNEQGTKNLCDLCTKYSVKKIVFYSSVAVYGANTEPSSESDIPEPNLPYGKSKLAGERVLLKWAAEDASREVLIIRPSVVYGERNVANMFRLIEQIKAGRYFHIGQGNNVKSIVYVQNIVEATLWLMKRMKPGVEIFNYADSPQLTSREIATIIANRLDKNPISLPYWLVYVMGVPFDLTIKITGKDLPVSTNRIKKFCTETHHRADKIRTMGFIPTYTNTQGLQRMVDWQDKMYNPREDYFDV